MLPYPTDMEVHHEKNLKSKISTSMALVILSSVFVLATHIPFRLEGLSHTHLHCKLYCQNNNIDMVLEFSLNLYQKVLQLSRFLVCAN